MVVCYRSHYYFILGETRVRQPETIPLLHTIQLIEREIDSHSVGKSREIKETTATAVVIIKSETYNCLLREKADGGGDGGGGGIL